MFIKKEDYHYFEKLSKVLSEEERKEFIDSLVKAGFARSGEEGTTKIQIVGDEIFNVRGIDPREFITRTMIRKAYKGAKGG